MTIEHLKDAYQFAFNKKAEAIYFKPEQINLIGESVKYVDNTMVSCAFSHGVYLIVSKNNQSQYRFWSFSHPAIKCFEKRQFNRNKEQSWIKFSLNIFGQFSNHGIDIDSGFDIFLWGNLYDNKNVGHHIESITTHALNDQLDANFKLNTSNSFPKINSEHLIVISNTHTPHKLSNSPLINHQSKSKSKWEQ